MERGNTVCDFDPLEKTYGHSLNAALVNFAWRDTHIHLIDTPGYPDFSGQAMGALAAVDTAAVVINAQTGIELATRRMMTWAQERKLCRMIVVNKIDADNVDLPALLASIQQTFGKECLPINLPAHAGKDIVDCFFNPDGDADFSSVKAAHAALVDQVVEVDEALMALYLEQGEINPRAAARAVRESAARRTSGAGVLRFGPQRRRRGRTARHFRQARAQSDRRQCAAFPQGRRRKRGGIPCRARSGQACARPRVQGHHRPLCGQARRVPRPPGHGEARHAAVHRQRPAGRSRSAHLYLLQGKEYVETDALVPGDIGAVAKVEEIEFDAVLHDSHDEDHIHLRPLGFPVPMHGLAVETKKKGDEQRLFEVLHKLELEDPCFQVERHPATNETVIRALGELHLRTKLEKLTQQYKLELDTRPPRIPYRETISRKAEGHCRHKKQTGGAGQFGEVFLQDRAAAARRRLRIRRPGQGRRDTRPCSSRRWKKAYAWRWTPA